jgi:small GTP-binding protein
MSIGSLPRVIFVGDSGVGKTALIHRAKNNRFNDTTTPTIGAAITDMQVEADGKKIAFQFWDTAGQEIYRKIVPIYFKGISGAILVFSMVERQSFFSLEDWIGELMAHADEHVRIIVCANKIDRDGPKVSREEAEKWARDHGYSILFTSAVTGENVDLLVDHVVARFLGPVEAERVQGSVDIDGKKAGGACC